MEAFGLEREGEPVSQEVFDDAIRKLMSSELLRDAFRTWCATGSGVQKYPLDPLQPSTWDPKYVANPEMMGGLS